MWPAFLLFVLPILLIYIGLVYWSCHKDRWKP